MQPFEPLGDVEGAPRDGIAITLGLQPRLVVDCALERHRIRRVLRYELAQLVDLAVGHLQHAADIAQHAARLQGAEGDDLRDAVAAITLLHVTDHLVAPVLTEVDVEVRHRNALGIEKALEQKAETDRVQIGDSKRIGDERTGAGTAARPDRNALRFRPLDEIGDDQEVAGIFHADDDAEFEGQPLLILFSRVAGCGAVLLQPVFEAGFRGDAKRLGSRPSRRRRGQWKTAAGSAPA